ncbi:MAG: single-stranded DNA-binding protein [Candidatus Hydrogenedentes bacterium]|nr:single-stranded DNA-binding protein [Candidatus Hydrogenedentota bacterium]
MGFRAITNRLLGDIEGLRFAPPVTHVYNPLVYARKPYDAYWRRFGRAPKEVVLLGMNPGPFGMAQVGVPFGDVAMVRDWLGIEGPVASPPFEHPKRPVQGFACPRREVSGTRFWGWARSAFGEPDAFFSRFFVANYCPLCFMEHSGRNRTPDKLPARERLPLFAACDRALRSTVQLLRPRYVFGIGAFAEARAREALAGLELSVGRILHPSPASPAANRGWAQAAADTLREYGIDLP